MQALGVQFGDAVHRHPRFHLLQQACDPHLEELIQVAGHDGKEFHALQQRVAGVAGLGEYAPVEGEPREVAVDIAGLGRRRRCRIGYTEAFHIRK